MSELQEKKIYRTFFASISLVVALCMAGIFLGMVLRSNALIRVELHNRARAHFRNIVLTRQWNADYGGVYVEKKPGVTSNPYLKNPDIVAVDGRVFTKKNPALMTREISEYSRRQGLFTFHITSLKLLNPQNRPDAFEEAALREFERGLDEVSEEGTRAGRQIYRYMAPLFVEPSCLACHAEQGYRVGQIRGGISVTFDIQDVRRDMHRNLVVIVLLGVLSATLLLLLIYRFFHRLRRSLDEARRRLAELAATDALTGIANRRTLMERFQAEFVLARRRGTTMACMMIDLDDFKHINDTLGHEAGDRVLKDFSAVVRLAIRLYDVFGRYGGEEFMIVSPDSDRQQALQLAERIRHLVAARLSVGAEDGPRLPVTISVGVTELGSGDPGIDAVIRRADEALYAAKHGGKNRIESR